MLRRFKTLHPFAALAGMIVLAACSDTPPTVAPAAEAALVAAAPPSVVASQAIVAEEVDAPMVSDHGTLAATYPSNAVTYQFVHNPTVAASYILGTHMVSFPAYTICDPAVSTYGAGTWLNSCTKLTSSITITATTWTDSKGRPQIDFSKAIRFYQNWNGQLPAIYLRDAWASASSWGRVDYCTFSGSCVNEAATDSALATQRDAVTGYLFRLIRHFSGYNVWA